MSKRRASPDPDRRKFLKGATLAVGAAAMTPAVAEAQVREPPTERQDVLSKRAAEVGGMAPGVKAAKVAVHFAFSVADSRWVADHQRSVDCDDSTAISRLALDPTQNLVRIFQARHTS